MSVYRQFLLHLFKKLAFSYYVTNNSGSCKGLIPYIFKQNDSNSITELQNGIENLFPDKIFEIEDEKKLFSITEVIKDGNVQSRKRVLRKPEFCKFICEERNQEDDFLGFEDLFQTIDEHLHGMSNSNE